MNLMPYAEIIPAVRAALADVFLHGTELERQWAVLPAPSSKPPPARETRGGSRKPSPSPLAARTQKLLDALPSRRKLREEEQRAGDSLAALKKRAAVRARSSSFCMLALTCP